MNRVVACIVALVITGTLGAAEPVQFRTDVIAALSRAGCNQGACHGSPQGKNNFRLSLRGYDADLDYSTIVREMAGRRVDRVSPERSLILLKGSGKLAHGGGRVFGAGEAAFETIKQWIAEGCLDSKPSTLQKLEASVKETAGPTRQLVAKALLKDGTSRDVSELAVFTSSDINSAPVTPLGLVHFKQTADTSILVRYLDQITSVRLTHVQHDLSFKFSSPRVANFIDEHVFAKQKELQLLPAPIASDEVFLRRVYLDTIGMLPRAGRGHRVSRFKGDR